MAISGVGMTAKTAAAGRALESRRPDWLFDDPLAQALAGEDGFRWMEEMRPPGAPAQNPSIGPRTWFFDQFVTRAAGDGFGQVVLLAAGMGTRAFRLALPVPDRRHELDDLSGSEVADLPVLAEEEALQLCGYPIGLPAVVRGGVPGAVQYHSPGVWQNLAEAVE